MRKAELLVALENYTLEEKKAYLENLMVNLDEEVEMALRSNQNELATWKMSELVYVQELLVDVENDSYAQLMIG